MRYGMQAMTDLLNNCIHLCGYWQFTSCSINTVAAAAAGICISSNIAAVHSHIL
jgi:hypothetical protein